MNIDYWCIFAAKALGLLVLMAACFILLASIFNAAWSRYKAVISWVVTNDALEAFRKSNPERFKHFDKIKDTELF